MFQDISGSLWLFRTYVGVPCIACSGKVGKPETSVVCWALTHAQRKL